jgi:hypothetical protein
VHWAYHHGLVESGLASEEGAHLAPSAVDGTKNSA